jgi:hypothetical protein
MTARIDISGEQFGRWTALRFVGPRHWLCRCECGTEKAVDGSSLRRGISHGCIKCHTSQGKTRRHGQKNSRLYNIWAGLKGRCLNPKSAAYKRYGGRGITISPEWLNSFECFRDWALANGYAPDLTIDRKNNDGNYEPGNCRWATYKQQNRNYSRVHYVDVDGKQVPLIELAERAGLKPYTVRQRIFRMGWSVERALSTPVVPTFTVHKCNIERIPI